MFQIKTSSAPIFKVTRLGLTKSLSVLKKLYEPKALKAVPKEYQITSNEQRYKLLEQVLNKELSLKNVLVLSFIISQFLGCTNSRN